MSVLKTYAINKINQRTEKKLLDLLTDYIIKDLSKIILQYYGNSIVHNALIYKPVDTVLYNQNKHVIKTGDEKLLNYIIMLDKRNIPYLLSWACYYKKQTLIDKLLVYKPYTYQALLHIIKSGDVRQFKQIISHNTGKKLLPDHLYQLANNASYHNQLYILMYLIEHYKDFINMEDVASIAEYKNNQEVVSYCKNT